ncbi:hypothetical protein Hdeb2414_s0001g00024411 [Helianthus debilis subsp. tardiflorus]
MCGLVLQRMKKKRQVSGGKRTEFDAEKIFNPKVKHMIGKMVDRKVKGVKEFYEKKTQKEKVEPSLVCDWDGTYYEQ